MPDSTSESSVANTGPSSSFLIEIVIRAALPLQSSDEVFHDHRTSYQV